MKVLEKEYKFTASTGLVITIRPYTFDSAIEAGLVQFRSTQSLQHLGAIEDDLERIKVFSESVKDIAVLEFNLLIDSVASIEIPSQDDEPNIIVTKRKHIQEFLENCEKSIGKEILGLVNEVNKLGIDKQTRLHCEECSTEDEPYSFATTVELNPVNFFTAS
jgi:hypothetical protein